MDKITKLVSVLKDIKTVCNDILKKMIPVLDKFKDENNDILKTAKKKWPKVDSKIINTHLETVANEWLSDAKKVDHEIDMFLVYEEDGIRFNFGKCSFLAEVWNGDSYDKQEIEGLIELYNDLKTQFSNMTRDNLFLKITPIMTTLEGTR